MEEVEKITGRKYKLFDYHGAADAEKVIICMGSAVDTTKSAVDYLNAERGYKCGVLGVKLFRPWSVEHFMEALPKSVKKIAVLDRTWEDGAHG